jgi:hypothetical protein
MDGYRLRLLEAGHDVTSRWVNPKTRWRNDIDMQGATYYDITRWASDDMVDVKAADAIASFTDGKNARGGRHVEFGLGFALGKQMMVIGPFEHVFHYMINVIHYNSPEEFLEAMGV